MAEEQISDRFLRYIEKNVALYSPSLFSVIKRFKLPVFKVVPEAATVYLCPLCLKEFLYILDGKLYLSTPFSMDHYPPKSIGGKKTALVCKKCNSTFGKDLDHHILKNFQARSFFERRGSYPLTVSINKGHSKYRIEGNLEDAKISLVEHNKKSNLLEVLKASNTRAQNEGSELKINFSGSYPTGKLVSRALLKAGYLQFFNWAGYDFVFSHTAAEFRRILRDDGTHPLSNQGVLSRITGLSLIDGIYALTNPELPRTFFTCSTVTDPTSGEEHKVIVIIPVKTVAAWEEQKAFEVFSPNSRVELKYQRYNNNLVSTGNYFAYYNETCALLKK